MEKPNPNTTIKSWMIRMIIVAIVVMLMIPEAQPPAAAPEGTFIVVGYAGERASEAEREWLRGAEAELTRERGQFVAAKAELRGAQERLSRERASAAKARVDRTRNEGKL